MAAAPALNARSVLKAASAMASLFEARTRVSITTSSGTTLTRLPPFVMMGWTLTWSSSLNVSL